MMPTVLVYDVRSGFRWGRGKNETEKWSVVCGIFCAFCSVVAVDRHVAEATWEQMTNIDYWLNLVGIMDECSCRWGLYVREITVEYYVMIILEVPN